MKLQFLLILTGGRYIMKKYFTKKNKENNTSEKVAEEIITDESPPQRRIQDGISIKKSTRKMNLDRRCENSERRGSGDPNYKGPSRRYNIDRRLKNKDRRKTDWIFEINSKYIPDHLSLAWWPAFVIYPHQLFYTCPGRG